MSTAVLPQLLASRPTTETKAMPPANENRKVDARLLKKREADRKCQRKIRERAKARVASLEQVVEELKQKDTSGQVEALLKKLSEKNFEIETLNKKVKSIQAVLSDQSEIEADQPVSVVEFDEPISTFDGTPETYSTSQSAPIPEKIETDIWETHQHPQGHLVLQKDNHVPVKHLPTSHANVQIAELSDNAVRSPIAEFAISPADPIIPAPQTRCACSEPSSAIGAPRNTWRFANEVLSARFSWPSYMNDLDDPLVDDVPVRAVVEGWDAVERNGPVHPSWQLLKKIDQGIFWSCNPRERLGVLYIMHMLFDAHSHPEMMPNLPDYYRKRPSEEPLHSYAINFFAWPGLRERFVQQQHRYCTNDFWKIMTGSLRILWPYEFRDCYTRNIETGLYTISPLFQERLRDLKAFTVGPDMIQRWPELNLDVPVWNSIPQSVSNLAQGFRLLESNRRHAQPSIAPRRLSDPQTGVDGVVTNPQDKTLQTVCPKSMTQQSSTDPFEQLYQPLMWGSAFSNHADIVSESDYLSLQNLDNFTAHFS